MRTMNSTARCAGRFGAVYVAALILMCLFSSLALALANHSNLNMCQSQNQKQVVEARVAAECGMQFATYLLTDIKSGGHLTDVPNMMDVLYTEITNRMGGTDNLAAGTIVASKLDPNHSTSYSQLDIGDIELPGNKSFAICITVTGWDPNVTDTPTDMKMTVTGSHGGLSRSISTTWSVYCDDTLLHYAMFSTLRMIVRDDVRVHGPICSSWGRDIMPGVRNNSTYPLDIELGADGFIDGSIGTTLTESQFTGDPNLGDSDFHDGISSEDPNVNLLDQMAYEQQVELETEDFDTEPLKDMTDTANLPTPDATNQSLDMWGLSGSKWENWNGDPNDASDPNKPSFNNIRLTKGTNAHFKNCRFTGITYIEVDEDTDNPSSSNQNSVVFENCTFEGPVITGVPKKMDWRYNCMEFRGDTKFDNSMIQEALGGVTLMAPNYNVNIGGSEGGGGGSVGDSAVCGLVIGGCVDLYNELTVHGTVVSMAKLVKDGQINVSPGGSDSWLAGASVCGSNMGNLHGDNDAIDLFPDPSNTIPLGIKKKYEVRLDLSSLTYCGK